MSRSRGGLASKIHAVVDTNSPIREVSSLFVPAHRMSGCGGGAVMPGGAVRTKFTYLLVTVDVNAPLCRAMLRVSVSTPAHNGATTGV